MMTAIVNLELFNQALARLQVLEGPVSWAKVNPIMALLQQSVIPDPESDECPSPTPPNKSSSESETSIRSETPAA